MANAETRVEMATKHSMEVKRFLASIEVANIDLMSRDVYETESRIFSTLIRAIKSPVWKAEEDEKHTLKSEVQPVMGINVPATWWSHLLFRIVPFRWRRLRRKIHYRNIERIIIVKQTYTTINRTEWSNVCPHYKVQKDSTHFQFLTEEVKNVSKQNKTE